MTGNMMKAPVQKSEIQRAFLDRARRYCALTEQCESGVRQKLISWGAEFDDIEVIIGKLRADDYLNDVRYASAYCRGKLLGQRWGRQKVLYQLRSKHISKEAIEEGMAQVDDATYSQILADESSKKFHELGGEMTVEVRRKMLSFLSSRGYSSAEIADTLNHLED